jgi:hypothetical protein
VESEIEISKALLENITTSDGTLAPFFKSQKKNFRNLIKDIFPNKTIAKIESLLWGELSSAQKLEVFRAIGKSTREDFFDQRKIPNLKLKPQLVAQNAGTFLGKAYKTGDNIDMSAFVFEEHIEWANTVTMFEGLPEIELHLGIFGSPEEVARASFELQVLLGAKKAAPIHIHALKHIDPHRFEKNRIIYLGAQFFRFLQIEKKVLINEILKEAPIKKIKLQSGNSRLGGIYFSPAEARHMNDQTISLWGNFTSVQDTDEIGDFSARTKGYVGFANPSFYRDSTLFGIEFRVVEPNFTPEDYARLNRSYESFLQEDLFTENELLEFLRLTIVNPDPQKDIAKDAELLTDHLDHIFKATLFSREHVLLNQNFAKTEALTQQEKPYAGFFDFIERPNAKSKRTIKNWVWQLRKSDQSIDVLLHDWDKDFGLLVAQKNLGFSAEQVNQFNSNLKALQKATVDEIIKFVEIKNSGSVREETEIQYIQTCIANFIRSSELNKLFDLF